MKVLEFKYLCLLSDATQRQYTTQRFLRAIYDKLRTFHPSKNHHIMNKPINLYLCLLDLILCYLVFEFEGIGLGESLKILEFDVQEGVGTLLLGFLTVRVQKSESTA